MRRVPGGAVVRAVLLLCLAPAVLLLVPVAQTTDAGAGALSGAVALLRPESCTAFPGAVWTADAGGQKQNENHFEAKEDVYLYGGPAPGGGNLPDGRYFYRVTTPNGTRLSQAQAVEVVGGGFKVGLAPFADSSNGVYKAWLSASEAFPTRCSKTDNFKVSGDTAPGDHFGAVFADPRTTVVPGDGVARCAARLSEDQKGLTVTFDNAYPGVICRAGFDVVNVGNVPVHVGRPAPADYDVVALEVSAVEPCYATDTVLAAGERAGCVLEVRVTEGAEQGTVYAFTAGVRVQQ